MGPPQETEPLNLETGGGLGDVEPRLGGVPRILQIVIVIVAAMASLCFRHTQWALFHLTPSTVS